MTSIDPTTLGRHDITQLINGLVAPRPIAWVSTLSPDGRRNLAPFSFFNAFSTAPPTLAFGPGSRAGIAKDSLRNIRAMGEFVVNVVTEELAMRVNATSAEFAEHVDEWEVARVEPLASEDVRPPRVAQSPAAFECRVVKIVDLGSPEQPTNSIVIGRVTRIHVDERVLDGWVPDPDALRLVGRMGGDLWCRSANRFNLERPRSVEPGEVRASLSDGRPRALPGLRHHSW
jgi:flavin reductase (DIM6/NTAB) family NADH-FMN oxidoreductase RutF